MQAIVTYAIRPKGTVEWELKNDLVEDFTVQWISKQFERLYGTHDFIFITETHIEADSLGTAALERYFKTPVS